MGHPGEGYKNQQYRYVVDETMTDGRVCVRTLGWTNSTKGTLKDLNSQEGWANARYEEIADRSAELDRPTRWLASDMTPLPEYVPAPPEIVKAKAPVTQIVRSQFSAAVAATAPKEAVTEDDADFGALFEEEPELPSTDEFVQEMIAADDEEEDGWSI